MGPAGFEGLGLKKERGVQSTAGLHDPEFAQFPLLGVYAYSSAQFGGLRQALREFVDQRQRSSGGGARLRQATLLQSVARMPERARPDVRGRREAIPHP